VLLPWLFNPLYDNKILGDRAQGVILGPKGVAVKGPKG
jgi:hypothetical protein